MRRPLRSDKSPFRIALALLSGIFLASCAGLDQHEGPASWEAHKAQLHKLQHWTASGKLALRSASAAESASLLWRQDERNSELELSGPLGVGATLIRSDGVQLEFQRGEEHHLLDISSPEAIELSTGWDLPLQALPHWLKGIPAPDYAIQQLILDPDTDLLHTLRQDGWQVHYQDFGQFGAFTLPKGMQIERGSTRVKVRIRDWQDRTE